MLLIFARTACHTEGNEFYPNVNIRSLILIQESKEVSDRNIISVS